ncbi:alginate export family protein [Pseudomonas fulva]|uniref:Alginate export family protein n=2 Tax=Pseudomonas TaxID=286 RepID=A0A7S9L9J9_9PSED|nr:MULTISPECIES: alginate export family protein [Pseudomonas]AVF54373.1 alginate export family protein [Pseudomonas fulva]QDC05856.1 alginate export family protein [Pseudomonas sp. SWI7]QPH44910.1 alginate export family protein [Pseudomonas fulva]QPH49984.1 alginate export family protein [Pseudomonas fulva]CRN05285.1 Alginate production protein AlgE precursor [Pseudomonas sp. URMO17WK12:I11]
MMLNPFVKAGIGLGFALLWSCPSLAQVTAERNFGLEVKVTGQSEDDRDLGTRPGGDVNGLGLDLRPWVYGERGNWSAYAMGQAVTATDTIETDTLRQNDDGTTTDTGADSRQPDKSYLAMREFWVGYSGLTAYPGEQLRLGRQRLRSDDGMWRDTNIEALNWTFDTTLLKADLGVARRFSEYRTDLTDLAPQDEDRTHLYGNVAAQWTPGQWVGLRAHHTHDSGSLKNPGQTVDALDKTRTGDLTWLGLEANSDAYNWRNEHDVNYWGSLTWLTGNRDTLSSRQVGDQQVATGTQRGDVNAWATDLGVRLRLNPQWQVGAAYARGSGGGDEGGNNFEQTGLESNRSNFTGTRSRVHRFGEAFRGELGNLQAATLFASWQLRDDYDASFLYHRFWRVDGAQNIGSSGINAVVNDNGINRPLVEGEKDLGQEMDVVVTKYFKQGLLPASMSQAIDEPSALVRLRAGVFKPGDAYGKEADSYMHRAFVDVIWRF